MAESNERGWSAVQGLFEELVDLPPDEQTRRLTTARQSPEVIAQAAALLAASRETGILDGAAPQIDHPAPQSSLSALAKGQNVGGFTIDGLIGRGGMGEVYLAHRTASDFTQKVALKLLRAEAADRVDMFLRERRLLARLEHPGIARLIDAGIMDDGRPFMAMEYIEGKPIDLWCREQQPSLVDRLTLFRSVCDAVTYAHANLIIHRDIKPSNIVIDQQGKPRLLDFGIAKLLDDSMIVPATTQAMLTPDNAAPEQLDGQQPTVATDVYGLGVLLYQLVSERGPWQRDGASVPAIIKRILYEDPPLPSQAARGDGAIPPGRIVGDLDAIVMKAMRRKPTERYASVADLSADVERHLTLKPVKAREGTTRYLAGRFVRRYRWQVGASAAAVAALLIGAGGIAWQARETAIERDLALAEARRSEAVSSMLTVMLRDSDEDGGGEDKTLRQMLDQTSAKLVGTLDTSAKSAHLILAMFDMYQTLEDPSGADKLVVAALARGIGKDDPGATATLQMRAASSAAALGRTEDMPPLLAAAEAVFRKDPRKYRFELVDFNLAKAQLLRRTGKLDEAIKLLVATIPEAEVTYVEKNRDLMTLYINTLVYMVEANQLDAMPAIFARADALIARTDGADSMTGINVAQLKAVRLLKLDQAAEAERILTQVVAKRRARFGASAGLSVDLLHLGRAKLALGKYAEARGILAESYPMASKYLAPGATPALIAGINLVEAQAQSGDLGGARRTLAQLDPLIRAIPKPGLPQAMFVRVNGVVLMKSGMIAKAAAEIDRSERLFREQGPAGGAYLKSYPALRAQLARTR